MADEYEAARQQALRELGRLPTFKDTIQDTFKDQAEFTPSQMRAITKMVMEIPDLTPDQRAYYRDMLKDIGVYEWDQGAMSRGMSEIAKYGYMPEFTGYFSNTYDNLTPRQIESEYSTLFDDVVKQNGGIRPYDFDDFYYRLKERLDANSGARGERLDMGKGDRLDTNPLGNPPPQTPNRKALVQALLKAKRSRPSFGGPR